MTLKGKGYYLWKIPQVMGGDPIAIAQKAVDAGLSHMLIKIADDADWIYNYDEEEDFDHVIPLRNALRDVGISPWGWHYVRGDDPIGEAALGINRMKELELDGYVIDAEGEYKDQGEDKAAKIYMDELRRGLPKTTIAFSSYRYPLQHPQIPFSEFLEKCDLNMPQVYYEQAHNPEQQLLRCIEQYSEINPVRPIISTGPAYSNNDWRPSAYDTVRFIDKVRELGQSAVNFWSFDYALRKEMSEIWQAIAAYDWPFESPQPDMVERIVGRLNQKDSQHVAELYHDNAAHVTGARTVVGNEAVQDWYKVFFTQLLPNATFEITGKSGTGNSRHYTWIATSDNGIVDDGNDTIGLREGKIQYHYTYFTIT
jgi:hypothetical protein